MRIRSLIVVGGLLAGFVVGSVQAATRSVGDQDADGIPDQTDDCPQSPPGARVDAKGCALDEDIDGVADGIDRCPMSPVGAVVNASGCAAGQRAQAVAPVAPRASVPIAQAASQEIVVQSEADWTFYFGEGESDLSWSAQRAVKQSAHDLLPELEKNPGMTLVLSGHGDTKSDGVLAARLAIARAREVRDFLIASGVQSQRISVRVPGANEPRYFGASLARNCRVELRVSMGKGGVPAPPAPIPVALVRGPAPGAAPVAPPVSRVVPAPAEAPAAAEASAPPAPVAKAPPLVPAARPAPAPVARPAPPPAARPTPSPAVAATPERKLSTASVSFAPYSAMLDDAAIKTINAFVLGGTPAMLSDVSARVVVTGSVDRTESGPGALRLAESRASSVRVYLVSLGFPQNRLEVATPTPAGTRRVDMSLLGH